MYVPQIDPIFYFSVPLAVRRRLPRSLSETRAWTLTPPCQPLNQTRRGPPRKGVSLWKTANRSGNATPPADNSYAPSTTALAIFTQTATQGRPPASFFFYDTEGYDVTTFEFPSQKKEGKGGWEPSFASNLTLNFRVLIRPYWPGQVHSPINDIELDLWYQNQNVRGRKGHKKWQNLILYTVSQQCRTR